MSTQLEEVTETRTDTSDPVLAHIVQSDGTASAKARVMDAMVNGTPVTALCGHIWVPSRNPENHPPCQKCLEIFEFAKDLVQ